MRAIPTLILVAAMTGLGACATPPAGAPTPQETHPVRVDLRTFQVVVPVSRAATAQPLPADFVEEYYRRGRGPMTVVLPAGAEGAGAKAGRTLAGWLKERLIPAAIGRAVTAGEVAEGTVAVFFKAYVAEVPECGDWRGEAAFNPGNLPHTNFGCAIQRNVGLMLSDPGEMIAAPTTGAPDTARLVDTLERYRAGEALGAPPPAIEQTTIQVER